MKIQTFQNARFGDIRTSVTQGKPYFCLKDICRALEIKNHRDVKERLNSKGVVSIYHPTNEGGRQNTFFIDEPNLYRCIFQSRKKEAVEFQDWVFEEVLPKLREQSQIQSNNSESETPKLKRRTSALSLLPVPGDNVAELARLEEENRKLTLEIEKLRTQVEPTFKISDIAEELGMTTQELCYRLRQIYVLAWDRDSGKHIIHWQLQGNGFTKLVKKTYRYRSGIVKEFTTWEWTQKGRNFIIDRLKGKDTDKYFAGIEGYDDLCEDCEIIEN